MAGDDEINVRIGAQTGDLLAGLNQAQASVAQSTQAMTSSFSGLGATSIAATRNMSAWGAMQAEVAGHVGEHTLAVGRLEMAMARFSGQALGVGPVVEMLTASLSRFALGTIETAGVLVAVAGIIEVYRLFTAAAKEAADAQDKLVKAGESRWQPTGLDSPAAKEFNAMLRERADLTKQLTAAEALHDRQLDSVLGRNQAKVIQEDEIEPLEKKLKELQESIAVAEANKGGSLKTVTVDSNEKKDEAAANQQFMAQLRDARAMGTAATASVDKALSKAEQAQQKLTAGDVKGQAMHAEMEAKTLEFSLRTIDETTQAKLAANEADYMRRQVEIAAEDSSEKTKTENYLANERLRAAGAAEIRKEAADKAEKEAQIAAEKQKRALEEQLRQWDQLFSGITRALDQSVNGIIQGTTTMANAIKNIWKSLTAELVQNIVKIGMEWGIRQLAMTGILGAEKQKQAAIEAAARISGKAAEKVSAVGSIQTDAAVGAAGAEAATAAIPFVGPALAPAAGASAFGLIISNLAGVVSAAGGYDVPAGLNPMTQLHASEMVLPASLADRVRGMTGAGSGGGDTHFHVTAIDRKGIAQFFTENGDHIVRVLNGKARDFHNVA